MNGKITEKTIQPWIDQHECVQLYLQRLNSNKKRVACYLYRYTDWAAEITQSSEYQTKVTSPEDLLKLKTGFDNSEAEKLLDKFTLTNKFKDSAKFNMINAVKGFYRNNYKQLQSACGKFEYVTKKAQGVLPKIDRLILYNNVYNPRDQALVLTSTTTAIARETIALMQWNMFEENWMQQDLPALILPSEIIKGHNKGKYRGVKQVTFLTPCTKKAFIDYRIWYQKRFNHIWNPNDKIFLSIKQKIHQPLDKNDISQFMYKLTKEANVDFDIHDGRIIVQTALENARCPNNWIKKVKGRKVKGEESPYSKPAINELRQKYREALSEIEFLKENQTAADPKQQFFESLATVLERHPEKFRAFEQFLLKL